jgi:hypothetical protein
VFVNALWGKIDDVTPLYKDVLASTKIMKLAPDICHLNFVKIMPYGYDKCKYFLKDELANVVKYIQEDYVAWDLCNKLADGKDDFFRGCVEKPPMLDTDGRNQNFEGTALSRR